MSCQPGSAGAVATRSSPNPLKRYVSQRTSSPAEVPVVAGTDAAAPGPERSQADIMREAIRTVATNIDLNAEAVPQDVPGPAEAQTLMELVPDLFDGDMSNGELDAANFAAAELFHDSTEHSCSDLNETSALTGALRKHPGFPSTVEFTSTLRRRLNRARTQSACSLIEANRPLRVMAVRLRSQVNEQQLGHTEHNDSVEPTLPAVATQGNLNATRNDYVNDDENAVNIDDLPADANRRIEAQNQELLAARETIAALEAEKRALCAAGGVTSQGEEAGTSHEAQLNVARAELTHLTTVPVAAAADEPMDAGAAQDAAMLEPGQLPTPVPSVDLNLSQLRDELEGSQEERTARIIEQFGAALAKSLAQTVNTQMVRPSTGAKPSEIGLSDFSGASYKLATVIEPEYYPRLLLWLEESEHLLRNSGLSTVQQVRTLFAHLTGAARKQFTTRWRNLDFASMTMTDAREKIYALVPNHQTHFSRAAMEMNFRVDNLASDLDRFALYATHGDLPVNGHHFWYRMIQDKLLDACPDLFRLAAEHFGKRIEFDSSMTFNCMIERFMDIVLAVQTELKAKLVGHKRGRHDDGAGNDKFKKARGPHDSSKSRLHDLTDDFTLARTVGMCFGCGQLYPKGVRDGRYDKKAHDAVCMKPFAKGIVNSEFSTAIKKWRKLVSDGKDVAELKSVANSERK